MSYKTVDQIKEAMELMDGRDWTTWWFVLDNEIKCGLNANDLFYWACADLEFLEYEDLPLMRQCLKDVIAVDCTDSYAPELFACRKRQMRPQKPCYKHWNEKLAALFDACGPEQGDRG